MAKILERALLGQTTLDRSLTGDGFAAVPPRTPASPPIDLLAP